MFPKWNEGEEYLINTFITYKNEKGWIIIWQLIFTQKLVALSYFRLNFNI